MKTFDDILQDVGPFGLYQKRLFLSICLIGALTTASILLNAFLLGVPEHRCKIPGYDNDTFDTQGPQHEDLISAYIPVDSSGIHPHERCHVYVSDVDSLSPNGTDETRTCTEWVYDSSVFESTITKELDLVCDRAIMIPNAQSIMFSGVLAGSVAFGQISDLIGRRKAQLVAICVLGLSAGGLTAMTEYIGVCVFLFLFGSAILGLYMTSFVLAMEFVGPSSRRVVGAVISVFNTSGALYCLLMVYLLRSWRYFTAAVAIPVCLLVSYYWITPESCRWLLTKNRKDEAIATMKKIAEVNKGTFDEKDLDELEPPRKEERIWLLFSTRILTIRTLILFFNWFVCSLATYGFLLNIGNLGGSFYLNFTLTLVINYPVNIGCYFLLQKLGRRTLHVSFMLIGAVFCIATVWPILDGSDELHTVLIAFALIGQCCVGGAFLTLYILSSELYPTVVRNGGLGASSAVARVGSMLSPYIAKSADLIGGTSGKVLPLTVFGVAMLLAGISACFLPETQNRSLPETMEDANNFNKKRRKTSEAVPKDEINYSYEEDRL